MCVSIKTVLSTNQYHFEVERSWNSAVRLVVLGFNTFTAKAISWWSLTQCVSWLSHTSTNTTFFPKPPTTFLTCSSRGERQKYAVQEVCLIWVSNSQPPGHESDTLPTEPLVGALTFRKLTNSKSA